MKRSASSEAACECNMYHVISSSRPYLSAVTPMVESSAVNRSHSLPVSYQCFMTLIAFSFRHSRVYHITARRMETPNESNQEDPMNAAVPSPTQADEVMPSPTR